MHWAGCEGHSSREGKTLKPVLIFFISTLKSKRTLCSGPVPWREQQLTCCRLSRSSRSLSHMSCVTATSLSRCSSSASGLGGAGREVRCVLGCIKVLRHRHVVQQVQQQRLGPDGTQW